MQPTNVGTTADAVFRMSTEAGCAVVDAEISEILGRVCVFREWQQ
jgi:hypothetical protein